GESLKSIRLTDFLQTGYIQNHSSACLQHSILHCSNESREILRMEKLRRNSNAFRHARQVREILRGNFMITDSHLITVVCWNAIAILHQKMEEVRVMRESIISGLSAFVVKSSSSNR